MKTLSNFICEASDRYSDKHVSVLSAFCTLCCLYFDKFGINDDFIDFKKWDSYEYSWFYRGYGYNMIDSLENREGKLYYAAKQIYDGFKDMYKLIKK